MDYIFILLCLSSFIFPSEIKEKTFIGTDEASIKVILKGRYDLQENTKLASNYYYLYEVKLTNMTDSTLKFLAYDCSTAIIAVTDKNFITLCAMNCGRNIGIVVTLKSRQEFSIPILLEVNKVFDDTKFKIGLILLKPTRENLTNFPEALVSCRKSLKNVLWSDPVTLRLQGNPYEIR